MKPTKPSAPLSTKELTGSPQEPGHPQDATPVVLAATASGHSAKKGGLRRRYEDEEDSSLRLDSIKIDFSEIGLENEDSSLFSSYWDAAPLRLDQFTTVIDSSSLGGTGGRAFAGGGEGVGTANAATSAFSLLGWGAFGNSTTTLIQGEVRAGSVFAKSVLIKIYAADGRTELGPAVVVGEDGAFSIDVGTYKGVIIAKVFNIDTSIADYLDEATGLKTDFGAAILTAVTEANGGTVTLYINPATSIAARNILSIDAEGNGSVTDVTLVNEVNLGGGRDIRQSRRRGFGGAGIL